MFRARARAARDNGSMSNTDPAARTDADFELIEAALKPAAQAAAAARPAN